MATDEQTKQLSESRNKASESASSRSVTQVTNLHTVHVPRGSIWNNTRIKRVFADRVALL